MSAPAATSIVLLFGAPAGAGHQSSLPSEGSVLSALLSTPEAPAVSLICFRPTRDIVGLTAVVELDPARRGVDRALSRLGAFALRDRLSRIPLGRLINSLGPVDAGRVFWRTVRRSPEAMRLLREADVVIAVDAAAILTAWTIRRRRSIIAHYDHRAAAITSVAR